MISHINRSNTLPPLYYCVLALSVCIFYSIPLVSEAAFTSIPNPSLEEGAAGRIPFGWEQTSYGENNPSFEYVQNDGHDGSKSVKVTMANYVSGDAKWMYTPQPVDGGKDYHLTAWYKSNIAPNVVAQYTHTDGSVSHFGMPRPTPEGLEWQKYSSEFSVPVDVVTVSVFFYINENGWLQTDDYEITPYEYVGFGRPLVTITFDDGAKENVETALPVMERLGIKSTQCYMTDPVVGNRNQIERILAFFDTGHEICSHSLSHPDLTTLGGEMLTNQLAHSRAYLEEITGAPIKNFASPFGAYNNEVISEAKKYYYSHRTVDEGYNAFNNLDLYQLKSQNMLDDTTLSEFKEWVNKAIEENLWLILVYHKVSEDNVRRYDTPTSDFREQMDWLASTGVTVKRLDEALDEVTLQAGITYNPNIIAKIEVPKVEVTFFESLVEKIKNIFFRFVW